MNLRKNSRPVLDVCNRVAVEGFHHGFICWEPCCDICVNIWLFALVLVCLTSDVYHASRFSLLTSHVPVSCLFLPLIPLARNTTHSKPCSARFTLRDAAHSKGKPTPRTERKGEPGTRRVACATGLDHKCCQEIWTREVQDMQVPYATQATQVRHASACLKSSVFCTTLLQVHPWPCMHRRLQTCINMHK